jgi:oligoendopeptidase F
VNVRGKARTREQCAALLQETERAGREEAYRALTARMLDERDRIDDVYDRLVRLRHEQARNAGFDDYVAYRFAEMQRFDYTPADCAAYGEAATAVLVPAAAELRAQRREKLGVDTLRPWDMDVSVSGNEPANLFESQDDLVALLARVFEAVDPDFAGDFDVLVRNGLLDLMSRPGKAPGGYNCPISDIRLPFIFWNAVGRRLDLRVMLHEGGHAFHTLAARAQPVIEYRSAPTEFSEVASMSMELFGFERLDVVLDEEQRREYAQDQFQGVVTTLCHVALIDRFQAWVYTHPGHTREERREEWGRMLVRYQPGFDWSGLEEIRDNGWQKVPHLFTHPLYYIEYGIAQIGALQMWRRAREDHRSAVDGYRRALALGGSVPLPALFEAAGIRFAMDETVMRGLMPDVLAEIRKADA